MSERRFRAAMHDAPVPDEGGAEQRARRMLHAAFEADRAAADRPGGSAGGRRRAWRPLLALAAVAVAIAVALTPPGEAVGDWIADGLPVGSEPSSPTLTSLPTGGRLLVTSRAGPWVVHPDGSRRRLGDYQEAAWSPNGLFVVASRARQLTALEPDDGSVRWTLSRSAPVSDAAWSPDGFRIAYRSGSTLRVVAGDGTGDAPLDAADPVRPAWRPGAEPVLAYVNPLGTIVVRQTDSGRVLWRDREFSRPTQLLWSNDGSRLIVVSPTGVEVLDGVRAGATGDAVPPGTRPAAAAVNPVTGSLALVRYRPDDDRSEVVMLPVEEDAGRRQMRRVFAAGGRFTDVAWSPDGRWLLVAWRDADQWLFIRAASGGTGATQVRKVRAVSNIAKQFHPGGRVVPAFPGVEGWCC